MVFIHLKLSSFTNIKMRAFVLLCLLHVAFGQYAWDAPTYSWDDPSYSWDGPTFSWDGRQGPPVTKKPELPPSKLCLYDKSSCGCCLMKEQVMRMEWFFNFTFDKMHEELAEIKMDLDNKRASRTALSVALNNNKSLDCYGPFNIDKVIVYKYVFINLGGNYDTQTGIFKVSQAGVYSLSVTIYSAVSTGSSLAACANLQVNGRVVSVLLEQNGQDHEDSGTVVAAMKLAAGDQVTVNLLKGCVVCDHNSHYNTFTGFLLYATD